MAAYTAGWMTYGHLRTDCLYTGISSGPNARISSMGSLYLHLLMLYRFNAAIIATYGYGLGWVKQSFIHSELGGLV